MATNGEPPKTVVDFPEMPRIPDLSKLPVGSFAGIALVILLAATALTGWFTLEPEEEGVVTRFGQFVRTEGPGFHLKLPFGIERVIKVPVQRQLKAEFGFRTLQAGIQSTYSDRPAESAMLTGDLNAADVEWVVQYRIIDPYKFLFKVRAVEETFRDISEAVMREVVGDRTVNEVLTIGRQEIEGLVKLGIQGLCEQYETGIRVEQVVLQDVNPPDPVKASFNSVNQAEQEKERLINEAQSEYNKIIPRAEGEARQTIQQAEGYALNRVNRATGEAARFNALYQEFLKAPEVTQKRIYLETMGRILPRVGKKVVIDEAAGGVLPLLNLDNSAVAKGGQ